MLRIGQAHNETEQPFFASERLTEGYTLNANLEQVWHLLYDHGIVLTTTNISLDGLSGNGTSASPLKWDGVAIDGLSVKANTLKAGTGTGISVANGIATIAVLSGEATYDEIQAYEKQPSYVFRSVKEIYEGLTETSVGIY